MEIEKLRTFITVAETKNLSKAAERLYISQPNVTKQLKSLEKELDIPLFIREKNGIRLSNQGLDFLTTAQNIVQALDTYLVTHQQVTQTQLAFGTSTTFGSYFLPEYLSTFASTYPNLRISMKTDKSKSILTMLESGEIEFAILSEYITIDERHFVRQTLAHDQLVLILPPQHPLAGKQNLSLKDLQDQAYIAKNKEAAFHRFLQSKLGSGTFLDQPLIETGSQSSIKRSVMQGMGLSIVSKKMVDPELQAGLLCQAQIEGLTLQRDLQLIYPRHHKLSDLARKFIQLFK